jgi:hypothetical protein
MKVFIDNFASSGVEICLLGELPSFLSIQTIFSLEEGLVGKIAGERQEMQTMRIRTSAKLEVLQKGMESLHNFCHGRVSGL